uniref:Globin domain-containing protein n=1 Tax=Neolamprologus brichardi TaxID=32507 RepID=A0A3Q4HML2_NEOBR
MAAIGDAVSKIDDLTGGLSALSELHAFKLRVDPANFRLVLGDCLVIVVAARLGQYFTAEVRAASRRVLVAQAFLRRQYY